MYTDGFIVNFSGLKYAFPLNINGKEYYSNKCSFNINDFPVEFSPRSFFRRRSREIVRRARYDKSNSANGC